MERWESRWRSSVTRYQDLSTVTLVPCWSTLSLRFCTSEMKTHPIEAMLKRRFAGSAIVNVTGVRRAESRRRAGAAVADRSGDGRIWNWRPVLDWSENDVFACIAQHGLQAHPAYRRFGMSRVSCRFCIMSSLPDLIAATRQEEAHGLYRHLVSLEIRSSFAFQGAMASRRIFSIARTTKGWLPQRIAPEQGSRPSAGSRRRCVTCAAGRRVCSPMTRPIRWHRSVARSPSSTDSAHVASIGPRSMIVTQTFSPGGWAGLVRRARDRGFLPPKPRVFENRRRNCRRATFREARRLAERHGSAPGTDRAPHRCLGLVRPAPTSGGAVA